MKVKISRRDFKKQLEDLTGISLVMFAIPDFLEFEATPIEEKKEHPLAFMVEKKEKEIKVLGTYPSDSWPCKKYQNGFNTCRSEECRPTPLPKQKIKPLPDMKSVARITGGREEMIWEKTQEIIRSLNSQV